VSEQKLLIVGLDVGFASKDRKVDVRLSIAADIVFERDAWVVGWVWVWRGRGSLPAGRGVRDER
jgi:hypothetical protein